MEKNRVLIKYQDNFADNITSYAYAKIINTKEKADICYENFPAKRALFEEKMSYFNLSYEFISTSRVTELSKKAYELNDKYIYKKNKKYKVVKKKYFNLNDLDLINENIIKEINFKNYNFIKSHDILEKITSNNSIGIYIDKEDYCNNLINWGYIKQASKRLNKYIKQPKLYIFTKANIKMDILQLDVEYEIVNLKDWREEFYFLSQCKHKIIINSPNSYSINFWASILNKKEHFYVVFEKQNKPKKIKNKHIYI